MRTRNLIVAAAVALLVTFLAGAETRKLTVEDVLLLKRLELGEATILQKILDSGTTFSADDLEQLKKAGFGEEFIARLGTKAVRASEVIESISAKSVQRLLSTAGFSESELDSDGDLIVRMHGYGVMVLFGGGNTSIQMYFTTGGTDADLKKVNDWNKSRRFSRAYLDDDGDPVLESDLDLEGGMTEKAVMTFFKTFGISLKAFLEEVAT